MLNAESNIRPMEYPVMAGEVLAAASQTSAADLASRVRELEGALAELERQHARELDAARRETLDRAKESAVREQASQARQNADAIAKAIESFRVQRDEYLARVEHEVVRLALAIAERILHREAQMDPLLLSGAVRVALGQLAESTEVRLRVPAGQREMWAEMLRLMPGVPLRPEVVGDAELGPEEAVLEANLGCVDLGVRAQMAEIERGFFDLLDVRRESRA
jgi:flagellar assembly protein FliH